MMTRTMMVIFVDADYASHVEHLLDECDLPGYTEIPRVLGKGETGRKLGSRAFPGTSAMYIAAVDADCAPRLADRLRALHAADGREQGLKLYAMPVEELL